MRDEGIGVDVRDFFVDGMLYMTGEGVEILAIGNRDFVGSVDSETRAVGLILCYRQQICDYFTTCRIPRQITV